MANRTEKVTCVFDHLNLRNYRVVITAIVVQIIGIPVNSADLLGSGFKQCFNCDSRVVASSNHIKSRSLRVTTRSSAPNRRIGRPSSRMSNRVSSALEILPTPDEGTDCCQVMRAAPDGAAKPEIRSSNRNFWLGELFMFFCSGQGRDAIVPHDLLLRKHGLS